MCDSYVGASPGFHIKYYFFCLGLVLEKCHVSNNQVKFALVLEKCHFEILPAVLMNLDVIFYLGLRSCL